jgi:hypothetical protein
MQFEATETEIKQAQMPHNRNVDDPLIHAEYSTKCNGPMISN